MSWGETIFSTGIGALAAVGGGFWATACKNRREERSLCRALASELRAVKALVYKRDYFAKLDEHIQTLEATGTPFFGRVHANENYNLVFSSNSGKLGLLPDRIAERLPVIYYQLSAIKEDLDILSEAAAKAPGTDVLHKIERCLGFYRQLQALAIDTFQKIDAVLIDLEDAS